jgi:hypothetical protein
MLVKLALILGLMALGIFAVYSGTQPCTADSPRGPFIGGTIKIAGC